VHGLCAALPIETDWVKLLGASGRTEPFRKDFVELKASKACARVSKFLRWNTCHPQLPGPSSATVSTSVSTIWCKSQNFRSSKTHLLARKDKIIDHALLLRAGGLPPEPPRPLTHLTTLTLRSPTELGGLGIRRYSGLAGETACLRGRAVSFSRSGSHLNYLRGLLVPNRARGGGKRASDGGRRSVQS
jgi:hypothetical protein